LSKKIGTDVFAKKDRVKPKPIPPKEREELREQVQAELQKRAKAVKEIKDKSIPGELAHEEVDGEKPYDKEDSRKPKVIQLGEGVREIPYQKVVRRKRK